MTDIEAKSIEINANNTENKDQKQKKKKNIVLTAPKELKVNESTYDLAMNLLKLHENNKLKPNVDEKIKDETTKNNYNTNNQLNYDKWERMSQELQIEEIVTNPLTLQILKLENKNDHRKNKQFFESPYVSKLEACIVYKNKADYYLKEIKDYEIASKLYEESITFLFITSFNDDEEITKKQKEVKNSIFMNISFCKIQLEDYKKAIEFLNDCYIYNKKNLKCIYRIAHCYNCLNEMDKASDYVERGLIIDSSSKELLNLKEDIKLKNKKLDDERRRVFKKLIT